GSVRGCFRVPDHAVVHLLGHVLPGRGSSAVPPAARLADAAVPRRRPRAGPVARDVRDEPDHRARARPPRDPHRLRRGRDVRGDQDRRREAAAVMTALPLTSVFLSGSRRSFRLVERNLYVYRHGWLALVCGVFQALFYPLAGGVW